MRRTIVFGKCSFPISPFFFLLLCFSAFLLFPACLLACFSAFLCFPVLCFSASLFLCFSALIFCFSASLPLCFSASPLSLLLRFSACPLSLLLCFSSFLLFPASLLIRFSASLLFPAFFFVSQFSQINPKKHHFNHFNKPSTSPKSILSTVNPKPTPEKLKQLQVNPKHTLNQLTTMYIYICYL